MKKILGLYIYYRLKLKSQEKKSKNSGFTLLELLVAMIIAVLVIIPLLGFMLDILNTDRREQVKLITQQEIQLAIDFIGRDLQESVYIYDAKGIQAIRNQLPYSTNNDRVPVLVFWKRQFQENIIPFKTSKSSRKQDDAFVYSLVVYYLIQNNANNNSNNIWSDQFRIARFEIKDGIRDLDQPFKADGRPNYMKDKDGNELVPDKGFQRYDLSGSGTLEIKMNNWKKDPNVNYDLRANSPNVLIDYIDKSKNNSLNPVDCTTVFPVDRLPADKQEERKQAQLVPASNGNFAYPGLNAALANSSFYACVDIDNTSAKVFLRGNAYARLDPQNNAYSDNNRAYFPMVSLQVQGRGVIGIK
ncbi:hormogonium polysaccharide secretion pseudopilin HpsC [Calothrix sp. NIES-3974]|uniref:hormogonium polysaccharide secretion pseudopilin HpsC n=1 Tax=Calothrix sp. NIES-3974 TaxID=2005462 RepID=UPI000B6074A9|nr:hormogonium polysaccharide secretion pseudopilin HpsC [Calothrix sp. NIES-3974]BAZ04378.1 hypothetical protein NIES3974_10160 [Calothrix sp. NIES-3974]